MCWSLTASAGMVVVGTVATVATVRRGLPAAFPMALGYFTVMEGLQTAGHLYVGRCGEPANQAIALLSYLHIVFQPFFINALGMEFVPPEVRRRVRSGVYVLCAVSAAFMLVQLYPLEWAGSCRVGQPLCGSGLCVRSGNWHIAWDIPYNGLTKGLPSAFAFDFSFPSYILVVFLVPILYGSWRFALFHALLGPILAHFLTSDVSEVPTIWCLFSISLVLMTLWSWALARMNVERWYLWPRHWYAPGQAA